MKSTSLDTPDLEILFDQCPIHTCSNGIGVRIATNDLASASCVNIRAGDAVKMVTVQIYAQDETVLKPISYVTVYAITRHYGGPEEGGWWYNAHTPVCTVPLVRPGDVKEIEEIIAFLAPRFESEGDIYSVRGGTEIAIYPEAVSQSSATHAAPHYE